MKKIYSFCKNALQNKLGIWLTIGNVGFAVLNYTFSYLSAYRHGEVYIHVYSEDCLTIAESRLHISEVLYSISPVEYFMMLLNLPAIIITKAFIYFLSETFSQMCVFTMQNIENWTTLFFVAVQWLLIGYLISLTLQKRRKLF